MLNWLANTQLDQQVIDVEKPQAKLEQCIRRHNVEFNNIPNNILDNQLE